LVLNQHVLTNRGRSFEVSSAVETVRIVGRRSPAIVDRRLRIWAEWPRARCGRGWQCLDDLIGRRALFDPCYELSKEVIWRSTSKATVRDTRSPEESIESLHVGKIWHVWNARHVRIDAVASGHLPVIIDHTTRHDQLVIRPDVGEQFAAVFLEVVQVADR